MGGRCAGCGGQVMRYRHFLFHVRPTTECASCGARVRLERWGTTMALGGVLLLGIFLATWLITDMAVWAVVVAVIAVLGIALDYWIWRGLEWHPVEPAQATSPPTPEG